MNIKNNILKEKLKNVYFIAGTNCGGKSSMAKSLSEKFDMIFYCADDNYWNHRKYSTIKDQPNMNRKFLGWDEFFNREIEDKTNWLLESELEEMDFIIMDLVQLAQKEDQKVIVDVHCMPEILKQVSEYNRVIFLLADPEVVFNEYFERDDKLDVYNCILQNTTDPKQSILHSRKVARRIASIETKKALNSGFKYLLRTESTDFLDRQKLVIEHFGLQENK
ncbi:hypothetical protein KHQ81_06560 [Mycoplasmatota bacterium]|nr:hypothetical protein KHQ81_06560 [Mycoplasmatota bacterium]